MAIYFINISVDTVSIIPENASKTEVFNEQESLVEIIVDKVMGYEDAFHEF